MVPGVERFDDRVKADAGGPLSALGLDVIQANLGYRCNLSCRHCHVEGGPGREESMSRETAGAVLRALRSVPGAALDLTGGAPEMNPNFRGLVEEGRALGRRVIVRSNLALLLEPGYSWLPEFFAHQGVEVIASLPYYMGSTVDRIRGEGAFRKSIEALLILNRLGFGQSANSAVPLALNLAYNPQGAFLTPPQAELEASYKKELRERHGIGFNRLYTFCNMPIGRFREFLMRSGSYESYMEKLARAFNPETLGGIMCRRMVSVGWDGRLHDCDFNLASGHGLLPGLPAHICGFDREALANRPIALEDHCYGCTAGQGST